MKFGDIVVNGWASDRNPQKIGIVIKIYDDVIHCTNGRGNFWNVLTRDNKLTVIGSLNLAPYKKAKDNVHLFEKLLG